MRKTLGPIVTIDTSPPHRPWDGNQATLLFFPLFTAFFLVLMSTLSTPIVDGLHIGKVGSSDVGKVSWGVWGWCASGVPGVSDLCSSDRKFRAPFSSITGRLPESLASFQEINDAIPASFLIANGLMHIFATASVWMTLTWTLAASGQWHKKQQNAYDWTRWSFAATGWSGILILTAWALDLSFLVRLSDLSLPDGSQAHPTPGPAIFMQLVAFLCCLSAFIARVTWGEFKSRPEWTLKDQSDFHREGQAPLSALPPSEEEPPTWESLNIQDAQQAVLDEKDGASLGVRAEQGSKPSIYVPSHDQTSYAV
ncbi:hypothetical protein I350_04758 [Cryptococcus amylolentus CBS 6273]|uniref:Uncharacterized protein n=1 Tax=Cryptococcus amylolentus CBS 6273 TaxID=1296118 RepID=A0A1E3JXV6_9TREE|nr:hypothetical protein I350_04758 [Cryptococcus amylolentus CBS 6273]